MKAAVLHDPNGVPQFEEFPDPEPRDGELLGRVLAAGLHPLVRGHASNQHYTSSGSYPLIPGVDGVAELPDGRRVYTGWLRAPYGTFAERVAVNPHSLDIPSGIEPVRAAGMINPAMSSWLALRLRAKLVAGETVMVLGATGSSGKLAVQIARVLGAGRVIAIGRNRERLARLNVDAALTFDELAAEMPRTDIVLDYLWGEPALAALAAKSGSRRLRFVNIGQSAGDFAFTPQLVRSRNVELIGSGMGAISAAEIVGELPALIAALPALDFAIAPTPLAEVTTVWQHDSEQRIVFTP